MISLTYRKAVIVLSDLTRLELEAAPVAVRRVLNEVTEAKREYVELSEEASELANRYIEEGVLNRSKHVDAQHIAIATLARVDVLVSWEFQAYCQSRSHSGLQFREYEVRLSID